MAKEKSKTYVFKVSDNTRDKMIEYFNDKKRLKTPPYAVFQADEADTVVTLYESGKVMFQGISADIDAQMWKEVEKNLNPDKDVIVKDSSKKSSSHDKKENSLYHVTSIGSDEVGTGDYFGPVVVTAAYVKVEDIPFLEELGVKDSKKLDDATIMKIVPNIVKRIPYSSIILRNEEYNLHYKNGINLNKIKAIMHNKVLTSLNNKYPCKCIVVDQFTPARNYYGYLKDTNALRGITFVTKGEDKSLAVACASLISRYIFIKEFSNMGKELNVTLPKGAGSKVDEVGISLVKKYGEDILNKYAKINFKNTSRILKEI